jgi:ribosomal protein L4
VDRAAVRKAANGAVMAKVYRALNIPYRRELTERARLGRIRGRIALTGKLTYTDVNGRTATADLSQRARRLGITAETISAARLYSFIAGQAVPALRKRIVENGKPDNKE